jgi:hypothetical protein
MSGAVPHDLDNKNIYIFLYCLKTFTRLGGDQNKDGNSKTILQFKETGIGDTVSPSSE